MRGDRDEERSSVDEEEGNVTGSEYHSPPRDEEEETNSVSVRVVGVVVVTVGLAQYCTPEEWEHAGVSRRPACMTDRHCLSER